MVAEPNRALPPPLTDHARSLGIREQRTGIRVRISTFVSLP